MRRIGLALPVLFTLILVAPVLAQQWQTFYLTPSDPHWVREWDPGGRLIETKAMWISDRVVKNDPAPFITFKIPEFSENGGYIKFYYAQTGGVNYLVLQASPDNKHYIEIWRNNPEIPTYKTEATAKIPPGYVYLRFVFIDDERRGTSLILWKKIQYKVEAHTLPSSQTSSPRLETGDSSFLIICIAVAVAALTATRSKKTRSKKV